MSNSSLYNGGFLLEMMGGSITEVKGIAQMLFDLGPKMITEIEIAINNEDWEEAGRVAHKLKSSLKLWQMDELVAKALFIETNGKKNSEIESIKNKFDSLKQDFNIALDAMRLEYGFE